MSEAVIAFFSLMIACLVKSPERFRGIGQILTMPLFFASVIMPAWLQVLAHVNPLTYMVDGLRVLMLGIGVSFSGLALDFAVILVVATVLVCIEFSGLRPRFPGPGFGI